MLLMLAQQELIGHARDVIANHQMARHALCGMLLRLRHGTGLLQIIRKKLRQAGD
jgi:hypothetical protein